MKKIKDVTDYYPSCITIILLVFFFSFEKKTCWVSRQAKKLSKNFFELSQRNSPNNMVSEIEEVALLRSPMNERAFVFLRALWWHRCLINFGVHFTCDQRLRKSKMLLESPKRKLSWRNGKSLTNHFLCFSWGFIWFLVKEKESFWELLRLHYTRE